jgi:SAM-dependent methyltransferase
MGRMAKRRLAELGVSAPLVRGAAQELPFAAASFESVVATFPSETIMEQAALSEVRRVLDPAGVLVVVPLAYLTGNNLIDRGLEWAYHLTGQRGDGAEQVEAWLARAGFGAQVQWIDLEDSRVMVAIGRPGAC